MLVFTFCTQLLFAQSAYQFNLIDAKNGLSNNQVNSIFKDERGFVWFGTMSGLSRYDGYNFKVFRHKIGDTTSINDNYVSHVVQGPHHMLWMFTPNGWNIYDPRTEKFTTNIKSIIDTTGKGDGNITTILSDKQGNFWFVRPGRGLYKYTTATKTTKYFQAGSKGLSLYSNNLNAAAIDGNGNLWIVYGDGVLEKIDPAAEQIVNRSQLLKQFTPKTTVSYRMFADKDNDLWIFPKGEARGLFYFNPLQNKLLAINNEAKGVRINNNLVNAVTQDEKGVIWIGTDHGGINLLNKKDFVVKYLLNNESDPNSISQNSITCLHKDRNGIIWVGTNKKGANQFYENNLRFHLFQHQPGKAKTLVYNDVNKFVEDKQGNLWIGTNGGGLICFNRAKGTFQQYLNSPSNANSLSNNIIVSLFVDREGKLWIGTYFGGLDCFDGKNFTHYRHDEKNAASLADDRVWEIFEDSQQRLWVGTLAEGLDLFDRTEKKFLHYKPGKTNNTLRSGYVSSIIEDRLGDIWIGTSFGVDVLNRQTGTFRHMEHVEGDRNSLSHNSATELVQDSRGLIWVATRDGLNVFDPAKNQFKVFRMEDGLPDNSILTVVEDNNHNMWVTTPNGISNIIVSTGSQNALALKFKNYDETDGLQGRQFNENAAYKLKSGELAFGGPNGFNLFMPAKSRESKAAPRLVLTDLQVFNNSVLAGKKYDGQVVLPQSIAEAKAITLKYSQNVFTIEFSALEFLNADKIKYAYKLEGFNSDWLTTDARARKATFTNLNPGTYSLLIKASNEDGVWSNEPLSLFIKVLPPVWLTPYAYTGYVVAFLAALFFGRRLILQRAQARFRVQEERREAHRLHELDMMKIRFFTNVSHEFRTPLSLIISPAEKLIKSSGNAVDRKQFQLIHRNARRLLNLVNQLLDFRKLEEQELRLNKTDGDIIGFIKEICSSFSDLAETNSINFCIPVTDEFIFTCFDHDKLERVLFNLLSNAFKFTPFGGSVKVVAEVLALPAEKIMQIKVSDTGIGIASDKHDKIFERFFQNEVPGNMVNQGSGIGLAITKEFVRMHGGTITVQSEPGLGSCFIVNLPLTPISIETENAKLPHNEVFVEEGETASLLMVDKPLGVPGQGRKKTILLVEDNDDFRFYIKDNLKAHYNIVEAANGKIGWQKALSDHPDLIVSDISMPEMNGIDLCKKIKGDKRTSFIPVILLTALMGEEQQLAGLKTGASDYVTKPFNFEILLSKVKNLLRQQESFKQTYQKQVQAQPSEVVAISGDDKFMQQALSVIEKHMSNADFSVEEMSREMFMSRVALYKRILSLSNKTPIEFIRSIRLQRAAQLLSRGDKTVAEVAYEVGFNNPKYFSKYFKAEYNVVPSAYEEEVKKQD